MRRKRTIKYDEITLDDIGTFRTREAEKEFLSNEIDAMQIFPTLYMFVQDVNTVRDRINDVMIQIGETDRAYVTDYYGFDLACDEEQQAAVYQLMNEQISKQTMMDKFGMT